MRKLRAVIVEDDVDAVVESLGEAGIAEFIDMHEKLEEWNGVLLPHRVSPESITKGSKLLSRIENSFENLGVKPEHLHTEGMPVLKEPIADVLARVEQRLEELPIETHTKSLAFISRIDPFVETLEGEREDGKIDQNILEKTVEKTFAELESDLPEIAYLSNTIGLTDRHSLIEKIQAFAIENKVDVSQKLTEFKNYSMESDRLYGEQLLSLKQLVEASMETIETETKLGEIREGLITLHKTGAMEKQIPREQEEFDRRDKTIYFEVWVPECSVKDAIERITNATNGNSMVVDEPPASEDNVPVMKNSVPSYLSAFAKLVYAFGPPSSGDINPIPIMAITFSLIFGIMFADVGQGLLFVILGAVLTLLRRRVKLAETGDMIRYLFVSSEMFIFLGFSAIFFGFLLGEFFGPSGVIHPISLGKIGPFYLGGFEPTQEPMKMLKFAILVGTIHIGLGLILKLINEIRHRHYVRALVPICWLWLLFGGLFMWVYWGGISNITKWFAEGSLMLVTSIILPLTFIFMFTGIAEGFMDGVGFSVEVFTETLSHSMSYGRIMALGLVHSVMNSLFLVLGGVEHGHFPLMSIPIVVIGTVLVMTIEGLIVFVHTLRLHWVEWFSKFHTGEGTPFRPFKFVKAS